MIQQEKIYKAKRTNIGLLEGRRIVDTIASDSHDGSQALATLYDDQFLLGRGTREHDLRVVPKEVEEVGLGLANLVSNYNVHII